MERGSVRRWLIKANGLHVDTEYESEKKAWRKAHIYADSCINQDVPFYPTMTVECEEIDE